MIYDNLAFMLILVRNTFCEHAYSYVLCFNSVTYRQKKVTKKVQMKDDVIVIITIVINHQGLQKAANPLHD